MPRFAYLVYGMQAAVAQQMGAFQQFSPRQKPASFNLDAVMRQLEEAGSRRNH
jgi:arylsulfatase